MFLIASALASAFTYDDASSVPVQANCAKMSLSEDNLASFLNLDKLC